MKNFKQVEKVFGASRPDPVEIEKAKKVLKVSIVFLMLFLRCSTEAIAAIMMDIHHCRSMNKH